ncbi:hypothetical protein N6H14_21745 [Paenibacillus sp. CC-CFT747]|nr:hypothetical protein N6H14_21745 [Paenibacillus sp. CC-CFT747]
MAENSIKAIINGTIVGRDRLIPDGVVLIKDGYITGCGERGAVSLPEEAEIWDAGATILLPDSLTFTAMEAAASGRGSILMSSLSLI